MQSEDSTMGTNAEGATLNPYHCVVRGKVLNSFERLSAGDPSAALALMNERVEYTFEGEHSLGGTRTSRRGVEKWFGRLLRLLPGRFELKSVEVSGWPWRSRVVVLFEDTVRPAVGEPYRNRGVQVIELRWNEAVRIHTYVDTAKVIRALSQLEQAGISEAAAAPIEE
jgi:ketosteroid isomerase-like protein